MMKKKTLIFLIWFTILSLAACASPNSANPTPTIVRLDRSVLAEATVTTVAATSTVSDTLPSATSTAAPVVTPPASSVSSTTTGPATATFDTAARVEVVTPAVNLRAGPGLDYDVISVAKEGDQFAVTGLSPSGAWLQIVTADGKPGWITASTTYTRLISAKVDDLPIIEAGITSSDAAVTEAVTSGLASSGQTAALTGGQLVFATGSGGDLYSVNTDGTGLQKLASGVIDPVVSPDGTQVAFTRWDGDDWGAVYTLGLVDGLERVVAGDMLQPKSPTWSPDGQTLVVSFQHGGLRDPKEECRRYDLGERVRVPEGSQITGTTYNGDKGQMIVCFVPAEDLQWYLREIDLASGEAEDLPSDLYSYAPAWDPRNAGRIIYDGEKGLMQLDLTSGSNTPLTTDLRDTTPVFSPASQTLAMTYKQHDHWEVYTYDLTSGARQRLTKPPILADPQYNSAGPTWSPDGSQIAFLTDRSGHWEIWVMNADGSAQRPLFSTEVQAQLGLQYNGVNERLLNWIQ